MLDHFAKTGKLGVAKIALEAFINKASVPQKLVFVILVTSQVSFQDTFTDEPVRTFCTGKLEVFISDFSIKKMCFLCVDSLYVTFQIFFGLNLGVTKLAFE